MELDCTVLDNIVFDSISNYVYPIKVITKDGSKSLNLTKYGCTSKNKNAKCVIFPKGKTTWEGFVPPCQFKDGDVLTYMYYNKPTIYIYRENGSCNTSYYVGYGSAYKRLYKNNKIGGLSGNRTDLRLATEEEKQKLFDAIKANGYKWNAETKTLENLVEPKFKVGDRIVNIYRKYLYCNSVSEKISQITDDKYIFDDGRHIHIQDQVNWELVPNKFDITTLKPFNKVLARTDNKHRWSIQFFEKYDKTYQHPFICMGYHKYKQCIPYEGNEHLHNTTNDCDDFYKTWEK